MYASLGDGYCADYTYLPEGAYPPHLNETDPSFAEDKVDECRQRCLAAAADTQTIGTKAFYVYNDGETENLCSCAEGNCSELIFGPQTYTSYSILEGA